MSATRAAATPFPDTVSAAGTPDPAGGKGAAEREHLAVNLLGPIEVRHRGDRVPVPAGKARTLLAMLLLHPERVLRRTTAYTELWGESVPASAASNFRSYLAEVRLWTTGVGGRVWQDDVGWSLDFTGSVDVLRFQTMINNGRRLRNRGERDEAIGSYANAVAMYRDSPMLDVPQGPVLFGHAQVLVVLWQTAVEEYAKLLLEAGAPEQARLLLHDFLSRQPYREQAWAHLMIACARSGDVAAAVEAFHRACAHLVGGLNARPSPLLTSLHGAILRGDPAVRLSLVPAPRDASDPDAAVCATQCVKVCGGDQAYGHDKTLSTMARGDRVGSGAGAGSHPAGGHAGAGRTGAPDPA